MIVTTRTLFIWVCFAAFLLFASCEGTLNQRMNKVSETIKKVDSATVKVSEAATKLAKAVESYSDTAAYNKDSTVVLQEKQEIKNKQEKKQGGVFDSIFK